MYPGLNIQTESCSCGYYDIAIISQDMQGREKLLSQI